MRKDKNKVGSEEVDEEEESEEDFDEEESEEESEGKSSKPTEKENQITKQEICDMIEGNLNRTVQLLQVLRN